MNGNPAIKKRGVIAPELAQEMYAFYRKTKSLKKTAAQFNRRFTTIYFIFKCRGWKVQKRTYPELDASVVHAMYADYVSGLSLAQVGKKWKRRRQAIFGIFQNRGFKLRSRNFQPVLEHNGFNYTIQICRKKNRYYRRTLRKPGERVHYLHQDIWQENYGPIPKGFKVCFKDGDQRNVTIDNLELLSNSDQVRKHNTGANGATKSADARLKVLLDGNSFATQLKARAA